MAEDAAPLVEALALGEGFQVGILVVSNAAEADRAIGSVQRSLTLRLERPVLLTRLVAPDAADGLDIETLAAWTLACLPGPEQALAVVVDGSNATPRDEPAWQELFRRMNSRRNGIARLLQRALILCVTPRLEEHLAREAPDLWSVRGARMEAKSVQLRRERRTFFAPDQYSPLRYSQVREHGLLEILQRLYPDPRAGLPLLAEIGYPPHKIPISHADDFWERVMRELDSGWILGGYELLLRRLGREFPEDAPLASLLNGLPLRRRLNFATIAPDFRLEPDGFAECPEVRALAELLLHRRDRHIAIVGRPGAGGEVLLEAARQRLAAKEKLTPVLLFEAVNATEVCQELAGPLQGVNAALASVLHRLADSQRPTAEELRRLPASTARIVSEDVFSGVPEEFVLRCIRRALKDLGRRVRLINRVDIHGFNYALEAWDEIVSICFEEALPGPTVALIEPCVASVVGERFDGVVRVPSFSPQRLMQLLDARFAKAPIADRYQLEDARSVDVFRRLAEVAATPGAFLGWVSDLSRRWPMPPPPEWVEPDALAALVLGRPADDSGPQTELALQLGRQLDGPALPPEALRQVWGQEMDWAALAQGGLVERDEADPGRLRLSPVAELLKPSVQARLRE